MTMLILGLLIFLGVHSLRVFADGWRGRQLARWGEMRWKGFYSLVSLIGFVLLVWGFALARQQPTLLYVPPLALRHLNALFTLIAFVLVYFAVFGAGTWYILHLMHRPAEAHEDEPDATPVRTAGITPAPAFGAQVGE